MMIFCSFDVRLKISNASCQEVQMETNTDREKKRQINPISVFPGLYYKTTFFGRNIWLWNIKENLYDSSCFASDVEEMCNSTSFVIFPWFTLDAKRHDINWCTTYLICQDNNETAFTDKMLIFMLWGLNAHFWSKSKNHALWVMSELSLLSVSVRLRLAQSSWSSLPGREQLKAHQHREGTRGKTNSSHTKFSSTQTCEECHPTGNSHMRGPTALTRHDFWANSSDMGFRQRVWPAHFHHSRKGAELSHSK